MDPDPKDRDAMKELLFKLLRGIYRFEQYEVNRFGLTFQQIYLLKYLKRTPGITISEIAAEMRMKIFSATRLTDQLESKALVKREKSCADRRSVLVRLSKKGDRLTEEIESNALDIILNNISSFSEEQVSSLLMTSEHLETVLNTDK